MANKTATLKNQAGDNIYPNIVGDNRNTAIKDSTTIKHTLADNKISLDLDETIKGKIDAALQKPTGLTKTKLVGVGVNGQENIEIGDNLTLANGKLSATSGVNGLTSDAEGNLTASKDVKVDGKLKLKSLVSASNPDGDITKELGGGGGFNKYMIGHVQFSLKVPSGEHTYTIGEQVGFKGEYLTPPDDFNDGVCVLLGTSCSLHDLSMRAIDFISTISGDKIYYITGARITKRKEKYYIELGAYTINSGTATMGSSNNSFASAMYAWIYK